VIRRDGSSTAAEQVPPTAGIRVVSELYYPEDHATGYFLTHIAEGLARSHPVEVLCSQPTYWKRGLRGPRRQLWNGVVIRRSRGRTSLNKDKLLGRLVNVAVISLALAQRTLRTAKRGEIVLVVTNPPLLPLLVAVACRVRRVPYVLLVHDLYPDVLVAAALMKKDSWMVRTMAWCNSRVLRGAARVVVLGRDMESAVRRRLGGRTGTVVRIPNWGHGNVTPLPRGGNPVLARLGLTEKFVVQIAGNMGRTHGLSDVLEAADRLRDDVDVHFLFIGSGAQRGRLEAHARRLALDNITFLDPCPAGELAEHLNACDVGLVSLIAGMTGVSAPSRLYNIMAAGKPIIVAAPAESEPACVIGEEQIGWVVPPGDPSRLAAAIATAKGNPSLVREMGIRARRAAETKYTRERAVTSYLSLVAGLQAGGDPSQPESGHGSSPAVAPPIAQGPADHESIG
jgi:colanic acid biosynthesis glycosyl transferase WcaI